MASQSTFSTLRRFCRRAAVALLVLGLASTAPAAAFAKASGIPRAYAGIVVDAKSGKVLYSSDADDYRYPASVTKVMTLYILFQELSAGNIKLTDEFTVSKYAASASPTKLGLKAGSTISVENAIKSIVTISANDMARVIAENISGSEPAFAKRMTATAKALGMSHTVYYNASGLPEPRQYTTVRDQSILGIAVYEHFPKYYAFFQTKSFAYGRRVYGNHNNLLGHNGVDGIKTGYTGSAGYNLLTAARIDGRHIVVAGFGFDSGAKRDAKIRDLVKTYLPQARSGNYLRTAMIPMPGRKGSVVPQLPSDDANVDVRVATVDPVTPVTPMPVPTFRTGDNGDDANPESGVGDVDTEISVANIPPEPAVTVAKVKGKASKSAQQTAAKALETLDRPKNSVDDNVVGAWSADDYSLGAAPAPLGQTRPSAPLVPPVGVGEKVDPMTSGSLPSAPVTAVAEIEQPMPSALKSDASPAARSKSPASGWIVQIGAAPTEAGANTLLQTAASKVSSLGQLSPVVQHFEKDGQTFFRARFTGFSGQDDANSICKQLKQAKMSCLAMQG